MDFNLSEIISRLNFDLFYTLYDRFLALFPESTQWLVSAIVLISIVAMFFVLIKSNWVFIEVLIFLFPMTVPVLREFFSGIYQFVIQLLDVVRAGMPRT